MIITHYLPEFWNNYTLYQGNKVSKSDELLILINEKMETFSIFVKNITV